MNSKERISIFVKQENQFQRKTGKVYGRIFRRLLPRCKTPNPSFELSHSSLRLTLFHRVTGQKLRFENSEGKGTVYECKAAPQVYLLCEYQDADQADSTDRPLPDSWKVDRACPTSSDQNSVQEPIFTPEEWELISRMAANPVKQAHIRRLLEYAEKNKIAVDPYLVIKAIFATEQ
jgi:hypothetical protein